jgi:ParB family chromosome partitioning protein
MNNEWYTPRCIMKPIRDALGGEIGLDPASCERANAIVRAAVYYDAAADGLMQPWEGLGPVFLNPPYSTPLIGLFVSRLMEHLDWGAVTEAVLLTNSSTDTRWWQAAAEMSTVMCFPSRRIRFVAPSGVLGNSPRHGQTIFCFGDHRQRALAALAHLGVCR